MRRRRLLFRGGIAVLLVASMLTTAQSSQADDDNEPEWYAGLPDTKLGNWATAPQGGLSYAKRARQWFRTPIGMATADYEEVKDPNDVFNQGVRADGYFISPTGAPANYGYLEPMTVRSVGFGLMPVEATVQISQRRKDGYPIPVRFVSGNTETHIPVPGRGVRVDARYWPITVTDAFNVQILSVKVDGVDLALNGDCRTAEPAPVVMKSPEYFIEYKNRDEGYEKQWFANADPSTYYHPLYGGELNGSITIPPFTGCTTQSGDDLSRLLTLSVSGSDNPVTARTGWPCEFRVKGAPAPGPPGVSNPGLGGGHAPQKGADPRYCPGIKKIEYPNRVDR